MSEARAESAQAAIDRLTRERNEARYAVQHLIDHIEYSDSYGVQGSEFDCCHLCGGGGAPHVSLVHEADCPVSKYGPLAEKWEAERQDEMHEAATIIDELVAAPDLTDFATDTQWSVVMGALDKWTKDGGSDLIALGIIGHGLLILDAKRRAAIAKATGSDDTNTTQAAG